MIGKIPEIKKEKKAPKSDMIWSKFGNTIAMITIKAEVNKIPAVFTNGSLHLDFDIHSSTEALFDRPICQLRMTGFNVKPYFAIGFKAINQTANLLRAWLYSGTSTRFCVI